MAGWVLGGLAITILAGLFIAGLYGARPYGYYPFPFFFFPFGFLIFFLAVFVLRGIFWGWGWRWGYGRGYWRGSSYVDATEILRQRYAKGEISKDQFDQMMKDLSASSA